MATGINKLLEEMTERLLVCEICQEDFQSPQRLPRVLPCHHAFCELCLQQLTKDKSLRCPMCRRSIAVEGKFPVETTRMTILDLKKVMGSQEGPECQGCTKGTTAISKCLQCEDFLCEDCCRAHKTVKTARNHNLVSLTEAASNPSKLLLLSETCDRHNEESLKFYCTGCEEAACSSCFVLLHSGHKMVELETVLEEKRKELKAVCGRLETAIPKFQGRVDSSTGNLKALDTHHSKTSDKVRALFSKARTFLDDREAKILTDLAAKVKEDRLTLEEQQAKDESLLSEAQASLQFGQRVASLGLPSQLLSGPTELTRTCDDLESRSVDPAVPVPVYQVEGSKLDGLADVVKVTEKVNTQTSGMRRKDRERENAKPPTEKEQAWKGSKRQSDSQGQETRPAPALADAQDTEGSRNDQTFWQEMKQSVQERDSGGQSGNLGQRERFAQKTPVTQRAGSPSEDQSFLKDTEQSTHGGDSGGQSGNLGQRKRFAQKTPVTQRAGSPSEDQSVLKDTEQSTHGGGFFG